MRNVICGEMRAVVKEVKSGSRTNQKSLTLVSGFLLGPRQSQARIMTLLVVVFTPCSCNPAASSASDEEE
jgi:hypothetical protein